MGGRQRIVDSTRGARLIPCVLVTGSTETHASPAGLEPAGPTGEVERHQQ